VYKTIGATFHELEPSLEAIVKKQDLFYNTVAYLSKEEFLAKIPFYKSIINVVTKFNNLLNR